MKVTAEMLKGVTVLDDNDIENYLPKGVARGDITEIEIPNSVTEIGASAFYDCFNLESITIPNSVKYIGCYAFHGCENLKTIEIPNSVKYINEGTFYECHNLKSVTIPNSITGFGIGAFTECDNLKLFIVPKDFNKTNKKVYDTLKTKYPNVKIVYKK